MLTTNVSRILLVCLLAALISACASASNSQRYRMSQDQAPARVPTAAELYQVEPRHEPISRVGNLPYQVNGVQYFVLASNEGYSEEGIASWYGQKFHGHRTSMGEFFNMYGLTAAHKTLPLPSWVRVTNLDNNKEIVVRVNDRGPFHPDRIIDLSYAAAYALGIDKTGTGRVHIEAITPRRESNILAPAVSDDEYTHFIQVAAARDVANLENLQHRLQEIYALDATTELQNGLNRLLLGPFTEQQTMQWINRLQADGFDGIFRVPINQSQ